MRNLTGPHSGLPYVVEKPMTASHSGKRGGDHTHSQTIESSQSSLQSSSIDDDAEEIDEEEPSPDEDLPLAEDDVISPQYLPLPQSRSPSPAPQSEASTSGSSSLAVPLLPGYNCPPNPDETPQVRRITLRVNRSPKRAYDDAEEIAEDSQGEAKRSRRVLRLRNRGIKLGQEDIDIDPDADTPDLTSSGDSGSASSSPAATPPPSMVVVPPSPITPAKRLTRRQRKLLGLPKTRSVGNSTTSEPSRVSKGRAGKAAASMKQYQKPSSSKSKGRADEEDEWERNGTGRVDVRGFKELRI